jgi:HTH-type transcriptional repressor of NAD biosynthesis genes
MKKGIVLGKFMPLHKGHLALIDFAHAQCDHLCVILCHMPGEEIDSKLRERWLAESLLTYDHAQLISFAYNENELANTSVASKEVSEKWAAALKKIIPDADSIFTSEPYGDYVAEYMGITHISFDEKRINYPVSGELIRKDTFTHIDLVADTARDFFIKKIAILGTESTGKSILTEKLAANYNTVFVPEMARDIIEHTNECTYEHLERIAGLQAKTILEKIPQANKLLFSDTDLILTKSYSRFLFDKELKVPEWVEGANNFDLYLFLEPDCEYIQDGTRLAEAERNRLSEYHKTALVNAGKSFISINGNWDERLTQAKKIIDQVFFNKNGGNQK